MLTTFISLKTITDASAALIEPYAAIPPRVRAVRGPEVRKFGAAGGLLLGDACTCADGTSGVSI